MSKYSRGNRGKNRRFDKPKGPKFEEGNEGETPKLEETVIICQFREFGKELDDKHDRYERLVKISRDITIESKRIIFLLHSRNENRLEEAEKRISQLLTQQFKLIARELHKQDPYLYHRAFSPGIQEFIEAATFYTYLKNKTFSDWKEYNKKLQYEITDSQGENQPDITEIYSTNIFPSDYVLGMADLTGELMRKCINSLGEGELQDSYDTCAVVREIYCGFLTISYNRVKEISHKVYVLRNSLLKMEAVCYNIHVRGTEVPKHMLGQITMTEKYEEDDDEGYGY